MPTLRRDDQADAQQACRKWLVAHGRKDAYLGRRDQQPEITRQLALLAENLQRLERDLSDRLRRLLEEAKEDLQKQRPAIEEARQQLQGIFATLGDAPHKESAHLNAAAALDQLTLRLSRRVRPRLLRALDRLGPEYNILEKPLKELTASRVHCAKPVDEFAWILRGNKAETEIAGKSLFELVVEPQSEAFCRSGALLAWRFLLLKWRASRQFDFSHLPIGSMVLECLIDRSEIDPAKWVQQHQQIHAELKQRLARAWQRIRFSLEAGSSELEATAEALRLDEQTDAKQRGTELAAMVADALDKCLLDIDEVPEQYGHFVDEILVGLHQDHTQALAVIDRSVATSNTAAVKLRWWLQAQARRWRKGAESSRQRFAESLRTLRETPWRLGSAGGWYFSFVSRFSKEAPVKEALLQLTDMPDEAEVLEKARDLPPVYRRLFLNAPLNNREFMIGMDGELSLLDDTYARWRSGRAASVALVGPEGSGKTSLLNCFANEIEDQAKVVRAAIAYRMKTAADVIAMVQEVLQIETQSDTLAELISNIMKLERQVVLLEDGHQLFLRVVGARAALEAFFYIVMSTRSQLFWVLSFRLHPWRRISYLHQAERYFTHVIYSEFHSEQELREALLTRQRITGQVPLFTDEGVTAFKLSKLLAQYDRQTPEAQRALADHYFSALFDRTGGNMQTALYYWLKSLAVTEQGEIAISPCAKVDTSVIKSLEPLYLLSLAEVLAHGGMTPHEHGEIFNVQELQSRLILDYLRQISLVKGAKKDRCGLYQSYIVNPIFYQPISSTLASMHYLY
jgi:energy-coupling factor transporter ATP-binding protein EcfA2